MDVHKREQSQHILKTALDTRQTVLIGERFANVRDDLYHLELSEWSSTNAENAAHNPESHLVPSNVRPFGAWFDTYCNGLQSKIVTWGGT
jgi:hypothetical protein